MKATFILKTLLFTALTTVMSCMDNDVYNPDNNRDTGKVTDLAIPSDFTWSTTTKVAVNVTMGDKTDHTYTFSVYPQGTAKENLPIAVGTGSKSQPFHKEIIVPAGDTIIAVTQALRYTDGSQMMMEYNIPIVNGKASLNLGKASANATSTRSSGVFTRSIDMKNWDAMEELTDDMSKLEKGKQYKIPAGKVVNLNDNINISEKAEVYIAGTLVISDNKAFQNHKDAKFIVLNEKQSGAQEAGSIICKGDFTIKNKFEIENYGTINIPKTFSVHNGAEIENHGCIHAGRIEIDGNGQGTEFKIEEGGYVLTGSMWMQKSKVEMEENAFLEITGTLEFKNDCIIEGEDDDKWAVVKTGKVSIHNDKNGKGPVIKDNIFIICEDNEGEKPDYIELQGEAIWGNTKAAAEAGVNISNTGCFSGYIPDGGDGEVEEPNEEKDITLGTYTYAFEDQWPYIGDYDMNDLVLETNVKLHIKNGYATEATLNCKIAAIGATKDIAAAIQLDGVASGNISRIEYNTADNFSDQLFLFNANGTEQDQTLAVIPLFDNAHTFAGVNNKTIAGTHPNFDFEKKEFAVTVTFKENSTEEAQVTIDKWNYFISCNASQGKRMEIHLINGKATDLFDKSAISGDVSSATAPFKAKGNFCWSMQIPGKFQFPYENNNIRESFESFDLWITQPGYEWYNHPIDGKVNKL